MKRVLITGASGFIGSFLVEQALKDNFQVYAGLRKTSKQKWLSNTNAHLFIMDLSNKENLKQRFSQLKAQGKSFDYVIHAAGLTKTCHTKDFETVNYKYTQNLIQALIESDSTPQKFVFISSLAAFGPGDEEKLEPISNISKALPVSKYGKSKLKAEQYIQSLPNFPYLIFRPTGVYGPREVDYYQMYKTAKMGVEFYVGSKEQYLSFVHVFDISQLIIKSLKAEPSNKAYFVSDLEDYTIEEFNHLLKKELNKKTVKMVFPKSIIWGISFMAEKAACLFGKVPTLNTEKYHEISSKNWLVNSMDLVKDFDYMPQYDLKKGLKQTLEWYKKEKWL